MSRKNVLFVFILIFLSFGIIPTASAATIDLIDAFSSNTDDNIVRFGDQTVTYFEDKDPDYINQSTISDTFSISHAAQAVTTATIFMEHYGARPDLGYYSNFSINGYTLSDLELSGEGGSSTLSSTNNHDFDDDGNIDWILQSWGVSVDLLNLTTGSNDITFNVGTVSSNVNEVEIQNFTLDYTTDSGSNPVPEPATMLLFGIGLLGLAGVNRRKI